ncbi:hypothetical protein GQ457_02G032950 [Hibiscus cannabinus]
MIGETICIDYNREEGKRGRFARLAIVVNLNKPLASSVVIDGFRQKIEYEGLSIIFFSSGKYRHITDNCRPLSTTNNDVDTGVREMAVVPPAEKFGPWMHVTNRHQRRGGNLSGGTSMMLAERSTIVVTSGWFDLLRTEPVNGRENSGAGPTIGKLVALKDGVVAVTSSLNPENHMVIKVVPQGTSTSKLMVIERRVGEGLKVGISSIERRVSKIKNVARRTPYPQRGSEKNEFVHVCCEDGSSGSCFLTVIYASPQLSSRNLLWPQLLALRHFDSVPWVLGGVFNAINNAGDRMGGSIRRDGVCQKFGDFLESVGLQDLDFNGPKFTWKRSMLHQRIDGCVGNGAWFDAWPFSCANHLAQIGFDHQHILLMGAVECCMRLPSSFKYIAAWQDEPNFKSMLEGCWSSEHGIVENLEMFTKPTTDWNQDTFGNIDDVLAQEESLWFQRSRSRWIQDGNQNTRFYHQATKARQRRRNVTMIKLANGACDNPDLIKNGAIWIGRLFLAPVTQDGVKNVIFSMDPLKAPGIDGIHAMFYQRNWELVGSSVVEFVRKCFAEGVIPAEANRTILVLIPKVPLPDCFTKFRPISLCLVTYKALTKVIVNRLKPFLPNLVSDSHASFVPGRSITDNVILAQEVIYSMRWKNGRKGWMDLMIDLEKAYDRLEWSFIANTLCDIGLPMDFIRLIMNCIISVSTQISWNMELSDSFQPSRGIRQCDPMSPYIFVLCMERLSQAIKVEIAQGRWVEIKLSRHGPGLSHLLFADDIILFAKASDRQMHVMKAVLDRFFRSQITYRPARSLAFAGRVTLAKSVLQAIPSYTMQATRLPKSVCTEIEKLIRGYIWGSSESHRGISLVRWEDVQSPMAVGDLGFHDMGRFNQAFLMKIGFQLIIESNKLCVQMLRAKYKVVEVVPVQLCHRNCSWLWSGICGIWNYVRDVVFWIVRDGCQVDFWYDEWVPGCGPLAPWCILDGLPPHCPVSSFVTSLGFWDLNALVQVLPVEMVESIVAIYPPATRLGPDRLGWKLDKKCIFTVKYAYNLLVDSVTTDGSFNWPGVWRLALPQRICSFLWLALRGGLLIYVERYRRHLFVDVVCARCRQSPEDLIHVLRDCFCTRSLWMGIVPQEECKIFLEQVKFAEVRCVISNVDLRPVSQSVTPWCCPPSDWVKVNMDGAVNLLMNAPAIGDVFRSDSGEWLCGFSRRIGCCSIVNAKLWAILDGLQYVLWQGFHRVIIESDCREVVCCVNNAKFLRDHTVSTMLFEESLDGIRSLLEFDLSSLDQSLPLSYEWIHCSNLVGMGIIPLCFKSGENTDTLGLTGYERYTLSLPRSVSKIRPGQDVTVTTTNGKSFTCTVRFDIEVELAYFNHSGIFQYAIRNLIGSKQ